jgi:hypothetical protein
MRNGGRTDNGLGLTDVAIRQFSARIPHPSKIKDF